MLGDPSQPLRYINELACTSCGERVVHGDLIVRLAKDAVHYSKAMTVARQKQLARASKISPPVKTDT